MKLLEVRQLRSSHAGREVLHGIDLTVQRHELWVVLGPNGAGKSTLLRSAIGLHPAAGEILLGGAALTSLSRRQVAQQVAFVPQEHDAEAGFSALELVLMGRAPHLSMFGMTSSADEAKAREKLALLGLSHLATRLENQLSGGERRLVLLARALCQEPALLVLDEPTAFLDLRHQVETLRLVRKAVDGGLGALAVLHDLNLAAAWATHVLLLRDGKAVAAGPCREVLSPERLSELYGVPVVAANVDGQPLYAPRQV